MVVTLLEATIASDRVSALRERYREIAAERNLPDAIVETFLLHEVDAEGQGAAVRIATVWKSRSALMRIRDEALAAGTKPAGMVLLESLGATPTLRILDVLEHGTHGR